MGKIYKGKSLWKRYRFLDTVGIYEKIGEILEKKESLLWSIKNIKVSVNLPPIYRQHIRTLTLWQSKTERTVWRESQRYRKRGCPFGLSWKGICKSRGITCLYQHKYRIIDTGNSFVSCMRMGNRGMFQAM